MRLLFVTALLTTSVLQLSAAEPSAFGAGDLDSSNPYGLTPTEKNILKNKKTLQSVKQLTHSQKSEIETLRERLDGLQTILEGLAEKAQENKIRLSAVTTDESGKKERLALLEESVKANEQNIAQFKTLLTDLSQMIDTTNANMVTKDEYNHLVTDVNEFKALVAKELKSMGKSAKAASSSISSGDLATRAHNNFKKKRYTKAIPQFEELIHRNYKPARSHYMLGEIYYYRKDYGKAIAYYKESAKRYDKASYMPTLLFHTAVSMQKTKDTANAKAFYNAVIAKYPDSKEASLSTDKLAKLK
jgi:TolA-binding protein